MELIIYDIYYLINILVNNIFQISDKILFDKNIRKLMKQSAKSWTAIKKPIKKDEANKIKKVEGIIKEEM